MKSRNFVDDLEYIKESFTEIYYNQTVELYDIIKKYENLNKFKLLSINSLQDGITFEFGMAFVNVHATYENWVCLNFIFEDKNYPYQLQIFNKFEVTKDMYTISSHNNLTDALNNVYEELVKRENIIWDERLNEGIEFLKKYLDEKYHAESLEIVNNIKKNDNLKKFKFTGVEACDKSASEFHFSINTTNEWGIYQMWITLIAQFEDDVCDKKTSYLVISYNSFKPSKYIAVDKTFDNLSDALDEIYTELQKREQFEESFELLSKELSDIKYIEETRDVLGVILNTKKLNNFKSPYISHIVDDTVSFEYNILSSDENIKYLGSISLNLFFNEKKSEGKTAYSVISFNGVGKSVQTVYKNLNDSIDKLCIELEEKYKLIY